MPIRSNPFFPVRRDVIRQGEPLDLRQIVAAIVLVGMVGTGTELVLLEHLESWQQWVPVLLLGIGALATLLVMVRPSRSVLLGYRWLMVAFVASAALGLYLHYAGNAEFELELHASARGFELFWAALRGATPALAPGAMAQLGLLGLACTLGHPALGGVDSSDAQGAASPSS